MRRLVILQCRIRNIPYGTIAAPSWRPVHLGNGVKPPEGNDLKDLAIEYALHENIALPSTKAEQRDAGGGDRRLQLLAQLRIPEIKWMQQRFIDLRTGAYQHKRSMTSVNNAKAPNSGLLCRADQCVASSCRRDQAVDGVETRLNRDNVFFAIVVRPSGDEHLRGVFEGPHWLVSLLIVPEERQRGKFCACVPKHYKWSPRSECFSNLASNVPNDVAA